MITAGHPGTRATVKLVRWTHTGKVQVQERTPRGGYFYAVTVFNLRHSQGRDALARELAALPRENGQ